MYCNRCILFVILILATQPPSWVETLEVARFNGGDNFYIESYKSCGDYKAEDYDDGECACDKDEFLVTAIHLNTALKCEKLKGKFIKIQFNMPLVTC